MASDALEMSVHHLHIGLLYRSGESASRSFIGVHNIPNISFLPFTMEKSVPKRRFTHDKCPGIYDKLRLIYQLEIIVKLILYDLFASTEIMLPAYYQSH
jgi:hypothetical protein